MTGPLVGVGIVLIVLTVPALVGLAILHRRRSARRQLGTAEPFRCKVRLEFGDAVGIRARYPRRWQRGVWFHDVVLFERGWLTPRLVPHPVEATGTVEGSDQGRGLVSLRLYLDGGAVIRVTADARDKTRLVGPFLMAELAATPNNRMTRGHR